MTENLYEIKLARQQVLLRVAPPESGQQKVSLSDIQRELKSREVSYNHQLLFDIYRRASNEFEVLGKWEATRYEVLIDISPDGLEATMTIVPPTHNQDRIDPNLIKESIRRAKLAKGLLYDQIQKAIRKNLENVPIVIARGRRPKHGKDGEADYSLTSSTQDAAAASMASVNLKEMHLIKNVEAKELVAQVRPPVPGQDGFTVRGRVLKAREGKAIRLKGGQNVEANADGTEFRAQISGYLVRRGDALSIEDIYQVDQVDGQSGNIRFKGVVLVRTNVEDGFTVESEMGIDISGSVGKAMLKSGGDIKVRGGIIGAKIECRGNVTARFISDSEVETDEALTVEEYILHSQIQAGKVVRVTSAPSGFINGGVVRAGDYVLTPNLGSDVAEGSTQVDVGMRPYLRQRYDALHTGITQHELRFDKLRNHLLLLQRQREIHGPFDEDKQEKFQQALTQARTLRDEMHEDVTSYRGLAAEILEASGDRGFVFVIGAIYPGVMIQIRGQRQAVQSPLEAVGYLMLNDEIKVRSVSETMNAYRSQTGQRPT